MHYSSILLSSVLLLAAGTHASPVATGSSSASPPVMTLSPAYIRYNVPNTKTSLEVPLYGSNPPAANLDTFLAAGEADAKNKAQSNGGRHSPLSASGQDPYTFTQTLNGKVYSFLARSNAENSDHFTWKRIIDTFEGLQQLISNPQQKQYFFLAQEIDIDGLKNGKRLGTAFVNVTAPATTPSP